MLMSQDEKSLFVGGAQLEVYDMQSGNPLRKLANLGASLTCLRLVGSESRLLAGNSAGQVHLVDCQELKLLASKKVHEDNVNDCLIKGEEVISVSKDRTLCIFSYQSFSQSGPPEQKMLKEESVPQK